MPIVSMIVLTLFSNLILFFYRCDWSEFKSYRFCLQSIQLSCLCSGMLAIRWTLFKLHFTLPSKLRTNHENLFESGTCIIPQAFTNIWKCCRNEKGWAVCREGRGLKFPDFISFHRLLIKETSHVEMQLHWWRG